MGEPPDLRVLVVDGTPYRTRYTRRFASRRQHQPRDPTRVTAHIPGVVESVAVTPGQAVRRGQAVLVLEAMKMRNAVTSALDGVVRAVHVRPGEMVSRGQLLVELS